MSRPLALQLYTVREHLGQDFAGTVRRVAEIGFAGVEPAGFPGSTAADAAALFRSLGLAVPSAHLPLPVGARRDESLDAAEALGTARLISGLGPEHFTSFEAIERSCDTFNEASANAQARGLTFGIHNHWWEFQPVAGRFPYQLMLERLDPAIFFEIDVYWVQTAGLDPIAVVQEFGSRAPLLHIKDGPAVRDVPQVAVGQGTLAMPSIIGASAAEWLVAELDACATDMFEAVAASYRYLLDAGLAHGREG